VGYMPSSKINNAMREDNENGKIRQAEKPVGNQ